MLGALFETVAPGQLSANVGVSKATPVAVQALASVLTTTSAGAVMLGFSVSFTVTVCVAVALLPAASVTVQVTTVTPLGSMLGALLEIVAAGQLSAKVGVPNATPVAVQA